MIDLTHSVTAPNAEIGDTARRVLASGSDDVTIGADLGWYGIGWSGDSPEDRGTFADIAQIIEAAGAETATTTVGWVAGVVGPLLRLAGAPSAALDELAEGRIPVGIALPDDESRCPALPQIVDGTVSGRVRVISAHAGGRAATVARDEAGDEWLLLIELDAETIDAEKTAVDRSRPVVDLTLDRLSLDNVFAATAPAIGEHWNRRLGVVAALDAAGAARSALARTISYAQQRRQFDRVIGSFQAYKHACANSLIKLRQAQSLAFRAAQGIDDDSSFTTAAAAAKLCCTLATQVCGDAIQLHGGIGFTWESGLHAFLKRARVDEIIAATTSPGVAILRAVGGGHEKDMKRTVA